jgi:hypothetical protein
VGVLLAVNVSVIVGVIVGVKVFMEGVAVWVGGGDELGVQVNVINGVADGVIRGGLMPTTTNPVQ